MQLRKEFVIMVWISFGFYIIVIGLIVWFLKGKKKKDTQTFEQTGDLPSFKDVENCLLQQTTSYDRGTPFLFGSNDKNELFLIYFYPNTFFIVKVVCQNNKFNVVYDYRAKHELMENFDYHKKKNQINATLEFSNASVDFSVDANVSYAGSGCRFTCDQSAELEKFASYLDTYKHNIREGAKITNRKDAGYFELKKVMKDVPENDKIRIKQLLEMGHEIDAIKMIQKCSGLGLSECKKIADNFEKYL